MSGLTHIDAAQRPAMVDVGDKAVTRRVAVAGGRIAIGSLDVPGFASAVLPDFGAMDPLHPP